MISVFDIDKLQAVLRDFYKITHIRITVFDENLNELVSYPEKVAPYCAVIRGSSAGYNACVSCDTAACRAALRNNDVHIYKCHAGLTEAVTPLWVGDVLAGYLLFGHVFSYASHEEGWRVMEKSCKGLPLDMERLKKYVFEAESIGEDYVRSAARILHAVASYLILRRMASLRSDVLSVKLDSYVSQHFTEKLTVDELCHELKIGKTQLYKLSGELYGCGIAEYIRRLRIDFAKKLLTERRELSISDVCEMCGFGDYNYFIVSFSKKTGKTPGEYRKAGS